MQKDAVTGAGREAGPPKSGSSRLKRGTLNIGSSDGHQLIETALGEEGAPTSVVESEEVC